MPKKGSCAICGATGSLTHMLLAHGPLATGTTPRRRRRARTIIPKIHRRLEEMGYDEVQAHQIVGAMVEELRKAGLV